MWVWGALPAWIALLNLASAILLGLGFYNIKRRRVRAHRRCMIAAFVTSALFLVVYLVHHAHAGLVRYAGLGWRRPLYFTILGSHTVLAAIVPVLVVVTLALALRGRFARHKRWARWTWPIWMYVSVTGIAVYWMLYR